MEIYEALEELDPMDDDHWTADGAPRIDIIKELVDDTVEVNRQAILDVAPKFNRETMDLSPPAPSMSAEQIEKLKAQEASDLQSEKDLVSDHVANAKQPDLEEVDSEILEKYMEGDIMGSRDFINFLMTVPGNTLESLRVIVGEQFKAAEENLKAAEQIRLVLKQSLGFTQNRIEQLVPDIDNQSAIQQFITAQNKSRERKVITTRELLKGVDLKTLDPRSAIDRAMARKNTRGAARPTR